MRAGRRARAGAAGAVLALAASAQQAPARAAQAVLTRDESANILTISGKTEKGDPLRVADAVRGLDPTLPTVVVLSGPGGSLLEGVVVGFMIRRLDAATRVDGGEACLSACALEWLAGSRRLMSADSQIGLHAPFLEATHESPEVILEPMRRYAIAMGLPAEVGDYIFAADASTGMAWMTPAEGARIGIPIEEVPPMHPGSGTGRGLDASYRAWVDVTTQAMKIDREGGADALQQAVESCDAAFRTAPNEDVGWRCFILDVTARPVDAGNAGRGRMPDGRFAPAEARRRVLAMLAAAGLRPAEAVAKFESWRRQAVVSLR